MSVDHKCDQWVFNRDVQAQQGQRPGFSRKVLAFCDEMMCVENYFETGVSGSLHSHPHTQISYIVEGKFEFTIAGETKIVAKGDTMLKQHGVEHGCTCLEKGIVLDFFTPMREDFV